MARAFFLGREEQRFYLFFVKRVFSSIRNRLTVLDITDPASIVTKINAVVES